MDTVRIRLAAYENVDVDCPKCGRPCRYNRVSDLKTTEPILGMNIVCLHDDCAHPFRIISDTGNARYEMLIYDCNQLIEEKQYAQCILNLCQAWECFFSLYFRVALCYRPFAGDRLDIVRINGNLEMLYSTIEKWTYSSLRNAYAGIISTHGECVPEVAIEVALSEMKKYQWVRVEKSVVSTNDKKWKAHLSKLEKVNIGAIRNRVVHKEAYRPSLQVAKDAIEETRSVLSELAQETEMMGEDPNWYLR